MRVLSYYLAGWHIKPKGVKKPYVLAAQLMPFWYSYALIDTIRSSESSSELDMIIPMDLMAFISPSKVGCRYFHRAQ